MTIAQGSKDQGAWSLWGAAILASGGVPILVLGIVIGIIACAAGYTLVATPDAPAWMFVSACLSGAAFMYWLLRTFGRTGSAANAPCSTKPE